MTQKELLYLEDAVGHESNIITIIEESLKYLQDENLISFLNDELSNHIDIKQNLINLLEVKASE